jgi:cell division protein FtsZ
MAGLPALGGSNAIGTSVDLNVPSVWRTNRTQAAAKVDALSSGGMDDIEIPAFLRRQAD